MRLSQSLPVHDGSTFPSSILRQRVPLIVDPKVSHTAPEVVTRQVLVVPIVAVKRLAQTPQIEGVVNVLRGDAILHFFIVFHRFR